MVEHLSIGIMHIETITSFLSHLQNTLPSGQDENALNPTGLNGFSFAKVFRLLRLFSFIPFIAAFSS
jgi:hypothetical protein